MNPHTGNRTHLGDLEGLANLGHALDGLLDLGSQQTLHRRLDVLDGFVDDAVGTNLDRVLVRKVSSLGVGSDVEADDDRAVGLGEGDVGLRDATDSGVKELDGRTLDVDLVERPLDCLKRTVHIGLDDEVELYLLALARLRQELLEADRLGSRLGLLTLGLEAMLYERSGGLVVLDDDEVVARARDVLNTNDLDG